MTDAEKEAVRHLAAALIAIEPHLSTPYPDDPRWTPWTRFVEPPLEYLYELAFPPRPQRDP